MSLSPPASLILLGTRAAVSATTTNDGFDVSFVSYFAKTFSITTTAAGTFTDVSEKIRVSLATASVEQRPAAFVDYDRDGQTRSLRRNYI